MLKTIADVSPVLLSFIEELEFSLSRPQKRHIAQVADALFTTEGSKTLSALYRSIVGDPCPKAAADTFREAPWTADDLRFPLCAHLVALVFKMAAAMGLDKHVFLSLDDSTTDKDKYSERLQIVDWFIDLGRSLPGKPVFTKGTVYVLLRITIGPLSFTIDIVPYLRASTVRRLNRERPGGERLKFRTKIQIAREMLEAVAPLIPAGYQVTALCDSWYAFASTGNSMLNVCSIRPARWSFKPVISLRCWRASPLPQHRPDRSGLSRLSTRPCSMALPAESCFRLPSWQRIAPHLLLVPVKKGETCIVSGEPIPHPAASVATSSGS